MAKLSSDGKYVIVESGDTLSQIAVDYAGGYSAYKTLAAINNISNPNKISIGQKIYLKKTSGSSSSSKTNTNCAVINAFGLQSDVEKTLLASWTWTYHGGKTDKYELEWTYCTKDKKSDGSYIWFKGGEKETEELYSTFSIPDNAVEIRFKVKPISVSWTETEETRTSTGVQFIDEIIKPKTSEQVTKVHFNANWSDTKKFYTSKLPPDTPTSAPSVSIKGYALTASLENVESDIDKIRFYIYQNNSNKVYKQAEVSIKTASASYTWYNLPAGYGYKVRYVLIRDSLTSDYSPYSQNYYTPPVASSGISKLEALSDTSIKVTWAGSNVAESYDIEYTTKKIYFDAASSEVQSTSVNHPTMFAIINGLESGEEYFFRVRVINEHGESGWTPIKSIIIGKPPEAPTTWSSTTTAIVGERLTLYWTHNTEDGSAQTLANLELTIDGVVSEPTITIRTEPTEEDEEETDKIYSYSIETTAFPEGTKLEWRVRTMGILSAYGDWSVKRTVNIYAPPTLELDIIDSESNSLETIESFPFYITGLAGPNTQAPVGYHVEILAKDDYDTTDSIGNDLHINAGDALYSKYFDTSDPLMVEMSASNIDLENGLDYIAKVTVSMNSGLTAEESVEFHVSWSEVQYVPNAEIGINTKNFSAVIRPYCEDVYTVYYGVDYLNDTYTRTETTYDGVYGEIVEGAKTTTGEEVYFGVSDDGAEIYYCIVEESTLVEDVTLSVYRREFDGSFTEIATGLVNGNSTFCTDPHPALDFARYRIVATGVNTGAVGYYDVPGVYVGCGSIIIQWDEEWSNFEDPGYVDSLSEPSWTGSFLELPYNIDVSDSNSSDVTFVKYIGREHPVSYYGTQLGVTSSWSTEIPKDNEEIVYALRRLSRWMGDVYVREPSGTGYWANINVSFNIKHKDLTIPVTFDITRVEGGM